MFMIDHKKERQKTFSLQRFYGAIQKDKNVSEQTKKHWKHKPYKNDFGGGRV